MKKLKVNDIVQVIAGKDKKKSGAILKIFSSKNSVLVAGINMVVKSVKPSQSNSQGGFQTVERPINISNVQLLDKGLTKPTRVYFSLNEATKKIERKSKLSKNTI